MFPAELLAARGPLAGGAIGPAPALPVGLALALCFALSLAAIAAGTPWLLAGLTLINGALLWRLRLPGKVLGRIGRLFLWQTTLLVGLYLLRFGPAEGLWPPLRSSWQLLLVGLPGLALLRGTSQARLVRTLTRVMPHRAAFALSLSLRFVPLLLREIGAIYEAQDLRGARILPRDLRQPRNWPDVLHCLVVPAVVQAMVLAEQIALAARAREFGRHPRRTCWPRA